MNPTEPPPRKDGDEPTQSQPGIRSKIPREVQPTVPIRPSAEDAGAGGTLPAHTVPVRTAPAGSGAAAQARTAAHSAAKTRGDPPLGDADPSALGSVFGGRFELIRRLGAGGMGEVFLVRDRQIEKREVALKVLKKRFSSNPDFRALFFREIRTAQGFVSEHVVQVRDCGQTEDGQLFLTMDYIEGEDLAAMLQRERTLAPRHALEIARQMLIGLGSGHEQGFVHRDIKPQNVMLAARAPKTDSNPYGVKVSILDFGIAGLADELRGEEGSGTPQYMSPEQAQGQRLDPRSDLFAVGLILYEMLAGKRPIEASDAAGLKVALLEADFNVLIDRIEAVPGPVRALMKRALQKERSKRLESAAAFTQAIDRTKALRPASTAPGWLVPVSIVLTGSTASLGALRVVDYLHEVGSEAASTSDRDAKISLGTQLIAANKSIKELENQLKTVKEDAAAERAGFEQSKSALTSQTALLGVQTGNVALEKGDVAIRGIQDVTKSARFEEILLEQQAQYAALTLNLSRPRRVASTLDTVLDRISNLEGKGILWTVQGLEGVHADLSDPQRLGNSGFTERAERDVLEFIDNLAAAALSVMKIKVATEGQDPDFSGIGSARSALDWLKTRDPEDLRAGSIDAQSWIGLRTLEPKEVRDRIGKILIDYLTPEQQHLVAEQKVLLAEYLPKPEDIDRRLWGWAWDDQLASNRIDRIREAARHLEDILQERAGQVEAFAEQRAGDLVAAEVPEPELILAYFKTFGIYGQPFASDFLARILGYLDGNVQKADYLTPEAAARLGELGPALGDLCTQLGTYTAGDALERLQWFNLARDWYSGGVVTKENPAYAALLTRYVDGSDGETRIRFERLPAWGRVLLLQIQLSKKTVNNLYSADDAAVFAVFKTSGSDESAARPAEQWEVWRFQNGTSNGQAELVRADYAVSGVAQSAGNPETILWTPERIELSRVTLELREPPSPEGVSVERWAPDASLLVQFEKDCPKLRISSALKRGGLAPGAASAETADEGWPCLRLKFNGGETWLSPDLGIIRERSPQRTRELISKAKK